MYYMLNTTNQEVTTSSFPSLPPPLEYFVSHFQLKHLLSWIINSLQWVCPPSACPVHPSVCKLSHYKIPWQKVPENTPVSKAFRMLAFVWKSTALAFQSAEQPTWYLSIQTRCLSALPLWWYGELVDQKPVNSLGLIAFKEGKNW